MGRYYSSKKEEADLLKSISVAFLKKHGYLKSGWRGGTMTWSRDGQEYASVGLRSQIDERPHININYTQTDNSTKEKKDFDYEIPLITTACNLGGKRYWFKCPWYKNGVYCGRRVGVLYKSGDYFACRHCNNLSYNSRNENRNYAYFPLFHSLRIEKKIDELHEKIKRTTYAGRPTKKQRKLDQLYKQALTSISQYKEKKL